MGTDDMDPEVLRQRRSDERHHLTLLRPFVLAALPAYVSNLGCDQPVKMAYAVAEACLAEEQRRLDATAKGDGSAAV